MRHSRVLVAAAVTGLVMTGAPGSAGAAGDAGAAGGDGDTRVMRRYAADTWASMAAMTYDESGLVADSLADDGTRSVQTSTTNIGAYLWSAVAARNTGIIGHRELVTRASVTLGTLERMERDTASGQFYNWYDATTGAVLTTWPPTGAPLTPILSSVDNAWLATGLRVLRGAVPELAARASALYASMDFGVYYRPEVNRIAFHIVPSTGESPCCYDTVVSESRMATLPRHRERAAPARRPTSAAGVPSRPPATTPSRRRSPPARPGPTSASRSTRARTPTRACGSCRAGAAVRSRR